MDQLLPGQQPAQRLALNEHAIADLTGLSVHTLRKDRQGPRRIPFMKIGGAVRYNPDSVRAALERMEIGGPSARADRHDATAR